MTVKSSPINNNVDGQNISSEATSTTSTSIQVNKRPKPVIQWTVPDVQKWLRRHCSDYYTLYGEKFLEQDITGRSLVRLNENSLLRLEIVIPEHRQAILREISKLRLRTNILLLKDMENKYHQQQCQQTTSSEVH